MKLNLDTHIFHIIRSSSQVKTLVVGGVLIMISPYTKSEKYIRPNQNINSQWADTVLPKSKQYKSVSDTTSIYYNKGKLSINLELGTSNIVGILSYFFGPVNSNYKSSSLPLINLSSYYGISEKATIGMGLSFQEAKYTSIISSPNLTNGNMLLFAITIRYIHCIWSWKYFYYGFVAGCDFWKPNLNSTIFYDRTTTIPAFLYPDFGAILGFRITPSKSFSFHIEGVFNVPVLYTDIGISYRLNTHRAH